MFYMAKKMLMLPQKNDLVYINYIYRKIKVEVHRSLEET